MPIGKPVQPVVTYDGRIIAKPVKRDIHGEVVSDPSWVQFLKDYRNGKFEKGENE